MRLVFTLLLAIIVSVFAYQDGWYGISSQTEKGVSVVVLQSDTNSVKLECVYALGERKAGE